MVKIAAMAIGATFHGSIRLYQGAPACRRGNRGDRGAVSSGAGAEEEGGAETADGASRSTKGTG